MVAETIGKTALRGLLLSLAMVVAISGFVILSGAEPAFAAGKAKLSETKVSLETGTAAKLRVKNAKQKVKWTCGDRKIVTIKKKSGRFGQSVVLKAGQKTGTTWVKAKTGKKTLKCRVTVKQGKPDIKILPLSDDSVDLSAELGYAAAAETDSSATFDQAYADFAVRLLQATLKQEAAAGNGGGSTAPANGGEPSGPVNGGGQAATGNILISPDSVMTALTMTENGAAGATLTEMHKTLTGEAAAKDPASTAATGSGDATQSNSAATLTREDLNNYLWRLHSRLSASKGLIYSSSNSIWAKRDYIKTAPAFLQVNKQYHNASFYEGSFGDQTVADMNRWVYNNTRNMIDKIIDPDPGLSEDARLVLINAIAFEGSWLEPFSDAQVQKNADFTLADGKKQKVTMLNGTESIYLELAGGTGFCKYYNGSEQSSSGDLVYAPGAPGEIAFVGLLPPEGMDAADYAAKLTGKDFLDAWQDRKIGQEVRIKLPCFTYDYSTSMKKVLQSMGMILPFTNSADFSGMIDPNSPEELKQDLHIDDVLHKTHIELDQNGTKAAAVTAVIIDKSTVVIDPPKPKEVYLDRPFVYALVDTQTGTPLFLGVVEKL